MKKSRKNNRQLSIKNLRLILGRFTAEDYRGNTKTYKRQHDSDRRNLRKIGMDYYDKMEEAEKEFDRNQ